MAVVVTSNPSGLKLKFNLGVDQVSGKTIYKTRTFSSISPDATDQDVFDVGNLITSLQKHQLVEIAKIDNSTLSA
ncbi:DUF1659 domain-containing protein [Romboutsia sp.]|uniref:DUF1659 domain-containing protein n=1 Tax=Romboutsia sp. TaxID=1965302 RepID=UPI003F2B218F